MTARRAWRRVIVGAIIVAGGLAGPSWGTSGIAMADPGVPSCPLAMVLMCRFLPMAPDLDEDVDLTRPPPDASVDSTPPIVPPEQ